MTLSKAEPMLGRIEGPCVYNWRMSWFVYIAQARTGRYYTSITTNPSERIIEHNSGQGSRFARQQGPFKLVYISPPLTNKSAARKREIQIKPWNRSKKKKLITGERT